MSAEETETSPYELLGVGIEASEQEIKSAYRKLSLKVHPDRNPNNPDAAQKFHELNQAYELLLDPLRRLALNTSVRAKEARKARFAKLDAKRKTAQEDLEQREKQASKRQKRETEKEAREREHENERIKEIGRKMRVDREKELQMTQEVEVASTKAEEEETVPKLGQHDTTVKVKISLMLHADLTTPTAISSLLSRFGDIDSSSIVLSLKPSKKAPHKPPKHGTALVPFKKIGDAFAAVCASGRKDQGFEGIELSWVEGKEPPILSWLKKNGKLGAPSLGKNSASPLLKTVSADTLFSSTNSKASKRTESLSFSSFPESFPSSPESSDPKVPMPELPGLDFESITLMRLRQAERERLEREILEQEANE